MRFSFEAGAYKYDALDMGRISTAYSLDLDLGFVARYSGEGRKGTTVCRGTRTWNKTQVWGEFGDSALAEADTAVA